jgi:hypothetical protein
VSPHPPRPVALNRANLHRCKCLTNITPDELVEAIEACHDAGWTDGLPVVPPTPERVTVMLGRWSAVRDEAVAVLPPARGVATFERIAANAVMAGCRPEHFAVVVAGVRAIARRRFLLDEVVTTVHAAAPAFVVSGPLAVQIGMEGSTGALGPGNRANAAIGRALSLCIRNIAGGVPGKLDAATHGHPGKLGFCFTENTELSPWEPIAVALGGAPAETYVLAKATDAPLCIADMGHDRAEAILATIAASVAIPGTYNAFFREELWLVMSPEHAHVLAAEGLTRHDVAAYMHQHAVIPAGQLRRSGVYGFIDDAVRQAWLDEAADDEPIPIVDRPDRVITIVAGGPYGGYTAALFGNGSHVLQKVES